MTPLLAQRLRPDRSFERIYERHVADVYRYTLAVLRNPADAEDVTQTTFMNAYRAYQRGERPRSAQNWLIAIAHNVCRQRFRQSQRRVEEVSFDENVAESLVRDDEAPSAEDIQRALGHLAFNQRSALVMRELEGRSYAEIAQILGVSTSAVETLIFRGRRALREQLEGSLTCPEAELAISRQLDGRLPRAHRGPLRAHLRECPDCASLARRQRAQRSAIRALAVVPLPSSLSALGSLFGGGATGGAAAALGGGVAMKTAAVVAVGALAGGGVYEGAKRAPWRAGEPEPKRHMAAPDPARPVPAPPARSPAVGTATPTPVVEPTPPREPSVAPRRDALDPPAGDRKPKPKPKQEAKGAPPRGKALGRAAAPPAAVLHELPPTAVQPRAWPEPKPQRAHPRPDRPGPARPARSRARPEGSLKPPKTQVTRGPAKRAGDPGSRPDDSAGQPRARAPKPAK